MKILTCPLNGPRNISEFVWPATSRRCPTRRRHRRTGRNSLPGRQRRRACAGVVAARPDQLLCSSPSATRSPTRSSRPIDRRSRGFAPAGEQRIVMTDTPPARAAARPSTATDRSPSPSRAAPRGFAGDSIASALAASGPVLSRSFKYHRPRGILTWRATTSTPWCRSRPGRMCGPSATCRRRGCAVRTMPDRSTATGMRGSSVRPLPAGRLLLQGVLSPERRLEVLGAHHPRAGRPRPRRPDGRARPLRQGLSVLRRAVVGGGPAGLRRRSPPRKQVPGSA